MSPVTRGLLVACAVALLARARSDSVCSDDFYGVLQGTPHKLPEHYLLPRVFDWAVAIPSVCGTELVAGVEARVCAWLTPPSVRIVDVSAALVHTASAKPSYLTVNVTVYCSSQQPAPAALASTAAAAAVSLDSASVESGQSLLRATTLPRNTPQPYWSLV